MSKQLFLIVLSVCWWQVSVAETSRDIEIEAGVGLLGMHYKEFDDNNVVLDREDDPIVGVRLLLREYYNGKFAELGGSFHSGSVTYLGKTQPPDNTPVQTSSDADIFDIYFHFGKWRKQSATDYAVYAGLGYRYWFRYIRPGFDALNNPVAGIAEEYYWPYGILGMKFAFQTTSNVKIQLDLRAMRMFAAKMDIDFLGFGGYDDTSVDLGSRWGGRIGLPIHVKLLPRQQLIIEPYIEVIDIGKSNTVEVTSGGVPTGTLIYEPRSETRNVGLFVSWLW